MLRAEQERVTSVITQAGTIAGMTDVYTPNRPPASSRQPKPDEFLFEFLYGHDRILCELGDDGEVGGVEAQFFRNEVIEVGRRFFPHMSATRTPREMAIARAEQERIAIQAYAPDEP
jgi:hypothetical protein